MSYRALVFVAAAGVSIAYSGPSQAVPIAPLQATLAADAGTLTPVYYYRHPYYHRHYYGRPHYHHYRY